MSTKQPFSPTLLHQCNSNSALLDAVIAGGGPAGLATALALAREGAKIVVLAPQRPDDKRTSALLAGSIAFLQELGIGDAVRAQATPLSGIRIADRTGHLLKAPETVFMASEAGLEAFGYNVANSDLTALLEARLRPIDVTPLAAALTTVHQADDHLRLETSDGHTLKTRLLIGADGRNSRVRSETGISAHQHSYDQSALVATLAHSLPHAGVSTELHRPGGPLTTVPGPGNTSNLVWVERQAIAMRLATLHDQSFAATLQSALGGHLGRILSVQHRAVFPLIAMRVAAMTAPRTALVGEAAHVLPPIGAQGLNMGLADAAAIASLAGKAISAGADPGSPSLLDQYEKQRARDVAVRTQAVDLLNRSLLADALPAHLIRGGGLALMNMIPPLRRIAIAAGLGQR